MTQPTILEQMADAIQAHALRHGPDYDGFAKSALSVLLGELPEEVIEAGAAAARHYVWQGHIYSEYTSDPAEFQDEGAPVCFHAMIQSILNEGDAS